MKFVATILFIASYGALVAGTRYDVTMMVDGIPRQVIVVRPDGAPPGGGYPLVFMFHGTSGDGEKFFNISGWKEKGDKENFITVFPSSLEYCITEDGKQKRTTKWHNGDLEEAACPGQDLADDVKFVRLMVDSIAGRFPVNRSKIYASGFSNGGGFVGKLAVEMSDVFAALAPSGGTLHATDSAPAKRNVPVWMTLGTKDEKWLAALASIGLTEFPFNDTTPFRYLNQPLARFRAVLGLSAQFTKTESPLTITYTFNTPAGRRDKAETPAAGTTGEFRFTLIKGLEHQYPNGTNVPVAIADYFWEFFKQHSLPATSAEEEPPAGDYAAYPNPANGMITIMGTGEVSVMLRDMLGRPVMETTVLAGNAIALPHISPGIYALEVRRNGLIGQSVIAVQK